MVKSMHYYMHAMGGRDTMGKKLISRFMILVLILTMVFPGIGTYAASTSSYGLKNPRRDSAGTVTWDCVTFGSYPRAEVVNNASGYVGVPGEFLDEKDIIEDAELFEKLESVSFNQLGVSVVEHNGSTYSYKRVLKEDAESTGAYDGKYRWGNASDYHYFRCEPIRWRVLNVSGGKALLLADEIVDTKAFDQPSKWVVSDTNAYWSSSLLRSWLNGYDGTQNNCGIDCSENSFAAIAFSQQELDSIAAAEIKDCGDTTADKIFVPSVEEVKSKSHGFYSELPEYDSENTGKCRGRAARATVYAKAMGTEWGSFYSSDEIGFGKTQWWLRTPAQMGGYHVSRVMNDGEVYNYEGFVDLNIVSVRPALNIELSEKQWSYAGTVNSKGEYVDVAPSKSFDCTLATGQKLEVEDFAKNGASSYKITESKADKKYASMTSRGIISAKKVGTATITLKKNDEITEINVTVVNPKFTPKTYYINVDEDTPVELAYDDCGIPADFSIPARQQSKATVSMNSAGRPMVTAIGRGTVIVTSTITSGRFSRKTTAKVKIYDPTLKFYKDNTTVKAGKKIKASVKYGHGRTTWSSSDETVAVVSGGKVKGLKAGTATITAVNNGKTMTAEVTVTEE